VNAETTYTEESPKFRLQLPVHLWPMMSSKTNRHVIGSTLGLFEGKERPVFWDMPNNVGLLGRIKSRLSQVLLTLQIWICRSFVLSSNFINFKVYFVGITCNIQLNKICKVLKAKLVSNVGLKHFFVGANSLGIIALLYLVAESQFSANPACKCSKFESLWGIFLVMLFLGYSLPHPNRIKDSKFEFYSKLLHIHGYCS
jgi:hypothetical protein